MIACAVVAIKIGNAAAAAAAAAGLLLVVVGTKRVEAVRQAGQVPSARRAATLPIHT